MHQHVRYLLKALFEMNADLGSDVMRLSHLEIRVNFQVQVHVIRQPGLPRIALFDPANSHHQT